MIALRYAYQLYERHLGADHFIEAGFTLLLQAQLLDWSDTIVPAIPSRDLAQETSYERRVLSPTILLPTALLALLAILLCLYITIGPVTIVFVANNNNDNDNRKRSTRRPSRSSPAASTGRRRSNSSRSCATSTST